MAVSMGELVDMPGLTRLPSRPQGASRCAAGPKGKLGRSLRRNVAPVMSCPVWNSLFASGEQEAPEASSSSRPGSRAGHPRTLSMSTFDARPGSSQSVSRWPGPGDRPGTSSSTMLSPKDARPRTTTMGSMQMSAEEMGAFRSDGLWWEWQKRGPQGWQKYGPNTSAELEEAYALGESSCRGVDLDALRNNTGDTVRRVRWPAKSDESDWLPKPPSTSQVVMQLTQSSRKDNSRAASSQNSRKGEVDDFLAQKALREAEENGADALIRPETPTRLTPVVQIPGKQVPGTQSLKQKTPTASSLAWPPSWSSPDLSSPAFRPAASGRATPGGVAKRRSSKIYSLGLASAGYYPGQDEVMRDNRRALSPLALSGSREGIFRNSRDSIAGRVPAAL